MMETTGSIGQKSLGIEISSNELSAVCIDPNGTVCGTRRGTFHSDRETPEQIAGLVAEIRSEFNDIGQVGLAVPGLIASDDSRVAFSETHPQHSDTDLASAVADALGVRPVIANDANAAAYGEFRLGAGRGSRDMFYVTLGQGVGGAFIFDGKIWHGKRGFAGEVGNVAINSEGIKLSDVASSENLVRRTVQRIHQDSTSSLGNLARPLTAADIIAAAELEDDLALLMLRRTGEYVGTVVAAVINLLNIEKVVLGGELMEAGEHIMNRIVDHARELTLRRSFEETSIVAGTLGRNAAAAGVALLASGTER